MKTIVIDPTSDEVIVYENIKELSRIYKISINEVLELIAQGKLEAV